MHNLLQRLLQFLSTSILGMFSPGASVSFEQFAKESSSEAAMAA